MIPSVECVNLDLHDRAEKAEAEVARLREAIEKLEWVGIHVTVCPWCGATSMGKHQEDCQRQAALSDTAEEGEKWNG